VDADALDAGVVRGRDIWVLCVAMNVMRRELSDFITGSLPLLKSKSICAVDHFPNSVENFY